MVTSAKEAVKQGLPFWRLTTAVTNSGDIFQSEVSGSAFVIGPESDVSSVNILYFDKQGPNGSNTIEVSTEKPHVGRLDALNAQKYNSGNTAILKIFLTELTPQTNVYEPIGFVAGDNLVIEPITLDLIQYFGPQPEYENKRSNRIFFYPVIDIPALGGEPTRSVWYVLPYYGRRYADIMFNAQSGAINYTVNVFGVDLLNGTASGGSNLHGQVALAGPQVVNSAAANFIITDTNDGMWDLLIIQIETDTPAGAPLDTINLKVITSDASSN